MSSPTSVSSNEYPRKSCDQRPARMPNDVVAPMELCVNWLMKRMSRRKTLNPAVMGFPNRYGSVKPTT